MFQICKSKKERKEVAEEYPQASVSSLLSLSLRQCWRAPEARKSRWHRQSVVRLCEKQLQHTKNHYPDIQACEYSVTNFKFMWSMARTFTRTLH